MVTIFLSFFNYWPFQHLRYKVLQAIWDQLTGCQREQNVVAPQPRRLWDYNNFYFLKGKQFSDAISFLWPNLLIWQSLYICISDQANQMVYPAMLLKNVTIHFASGRSPFKQMEIGTLFFNLVICYWIVWVWGKSYKKSLNLLHKRKWMMLFMAGPFSSYNFSAKLCTFLESINLFYLAHKRLTP